MVSKNKIATTVIILVLLSVLFSGCTEEKKIVQAPGSTQKETVDVSSQNSVQLSREENMPEIKITSFSSIYTQENYYDGIKHHYSYNISERYYAAYDLSIENKGSEPLFFKLNDLRLHDGYRIFNATASDISYGGGYGINLEVIKELENENKIQDTILTPGKTLNGTIVFSVDSLYDESFLLMYNAMPVTSASFEKSIKALRAAEHFNYSIALGAPPYSKCNEHDGMIGTFEPKLDGCDVWANWVNRSIFEFYQKSDPEQMRKSPPDKPDNIPQTNMVYALRVMPERNVTMLPVTNRVMNGMNLHNFVVVDDAGEEIINTTRIFGLALLSNQTYSFQPILTMNIPMKNYSNASVVQISFQEIYGESAGQRMTYNNMDIILDNELNIIVIKHSPDQYKV